MKSLSRLLSPRTIAVIGGKECERVVEQCDKLGFTGTIWPVHPKRETLGGRPCFKSVADLPEPPDAAYVAVNRKRSIDVVGQLAQMGAGGAVCYAAGFAEADKESQGSGDLQERLVEAAGDMPIIGPNCYGYVNALQRVALWPDQHGAKACESGVAILTQSSNIAINLTMQKRGLPMAYVMTVGNQAQTGLSALGLALLEDENVTALGLHIEGLDDVKAFEALAWRARELGKPVIALKVGKSEQAQVAAMTHTASLAGSDIAHEALFERLGIARVHSLDVFLETLKLAHCHGALTGSSILSLSCSGGEASLMADAAQGTSIDFPPFNKIDVVALKRELGPIVTVANPLDYNTFIWGDWPAMERMFMAALTPQFDLAMLVMDFPREDLCDPADWAAATTAFTNAATASGAKSAIIASLPETMPEEMASHLIGLGVAPLCGFEAAIAAVDALAFIGRSHSQRPAEPLLPVSDVDVTHAITLNEYDSKEELSKAGLVIPKSVVIRGAGDIERALNSLTFPMAIKALGIAHKSDIGAVKLNIADGPALSQGLAEMASLSNEFLVEEMGAKPLAELIVGVTRDPVVGMMMTLGAGGVLTELLEDSVSLLLPTTEQDIRSALSTLKIGRLLEGFRASDAADVDALIANIICIANYATNNAGTLIELDVNPLFATQFGSVAVDALIVQRNTDCDR